MNSRPSFLIVACLFCALLVRAADTPKPQSPQDEKSSPARHIKNVGVDEFAKLVEAKTNVVLDVRTAREHAAGHIAGAINIDVNGPDFEKKVAELDKGKTYLVHCAGGVRSAKACSNMEKLDFTNLVNLQPGFKAWEKAGKPVEKQP